MTKDQKENTNLLKPYQVFLLSCLLVSILILNSHYVNKNRDFMKQEKEKGILFNKIIQRRRLSESNENYTNPNTEEVCSRGSDDLNEYYKTGDLSKIDLEDGAIKCEDKDKPYMKALINIVESLSGDDDEDDDDDDDYYDGNYGGDGYSGLRNLDDIDTADLTEYGKRLLPMLVFLAFGLLGIIGWIVCCFCCCCNCCCCCCCKKESCQIPCFIFTYVFYAVAIGVCIYGLTQANKIFVGLANTECSMLKFFDEVLNGETKQDLPRWAGIKSIKELLNDINTTISDLGSESYQHLEDSIDNITTLKNGFVNLMHDAGTEFYDENEFKEPYIKTYTGGYPPRGDYVYDIVYWFGRYDETKNEYTKTLNLPSYLYLWDMEYSLISDNAFSYLNSTRDSFKDILNESLGDIQEALGDGIDTFDELMEPFDDANEEIGDLLSDVSGDIDKYGKMSVKIVFGVLMGMNIALAVLVLLISFFSGKQCTSCCFCRCIFKCCTHVLWNILALMMIFSFILGSIISLVGRIGGDTMTLITYIMSQENFDKNESALLLSELGSASKYIETCVQGDGDLSKDLNLGDSLDSFDQINNVEGNISAVKENFTEVINNLRAYYLIKDKLEKQANHTEEVQMYPASNDNYPVNYSEVLQKLNQKAPANYQWGIEINTLNCGDQLTDNTEYYPKSCKPTDVTSANTDFNLYAKLIDNMDSIVDYANDDNPTTSRPAPSVKSVIENLKTNYYTYLGSYIEILTFFQDTIHKITGLIQRYTGTDGDTFAFLNGRFIGRNLKIVLKYLKHSLGKDFYGVGICLAIVGFSLILSISSTILLIVIINVVLDNNIKKEKAENNPETVIGYVPNVHVNNVQNEGKMY